MAGSSNDFDDNGDGESGLLQTCWSGYQLESLNCMQERCILIIVNSRDPGSSDHKAATVGACMHDAHSSYEALLGKPFNYFNLSIGYSGVVGCWFWDGVILIVIRVYSFGQEAGGKVKSKTIRKLMKYKPGNYARDFFRNVKAPLASVSGIRILFYETLLASY